MSTESKPLIFEAITAAMNDIEAIGKNKQNAIQRFYFRGIDDVYNSLHPIFAKNKIFTVPEVLDDKQEIRKTRDGGGTLTYRILKIKYTCYAEDGSNISGIVIGEAMDSGDKSSNKAMSIGHKYFLMQLFAIPTEEIDDPDKDTFNVKNTFNLDEHLRKIVSADTMDSLKEVFETAYKAASVYKEDNILHELKNAKDKRKDFLNKETGE